MLRVVLSSHQQKFSITWIFLFFWYWHVACFYCSLDYFSSKIKTAGNDGYSGLEPVFRRYHYSLSHLSVGTLKFTFSENVSKKFLIHFANLNIGILTVASYTSCREKRAVAQMYFGEVGSEHKPSGCLINFIKHNIWKIALYIQNKEIWLFYFILRNIKD